MNEELKVIISAEISKLKQGVQQAKSEINSFKGQMQEASNKVNENFSKLGSGIAKGLKVGVAAMAGVSAAMLALVPATQEYRTEQAKLTTAFESAGSSADVAKGVYNDLYRVMGESDTAVEAANHLSQLTTNQQSLSEWTSICQGVYATFGDSLPIEGLTEAANETAKTAQVTGPLADAINWAKASNEQWSEALSGNTKAQDAFNQAIEQGATKEDAFNAALAACNSEAEREQLIREALTGLYDDAAKKYEENAAGVLAYNEAQAKMQESLAAVGDALQPVLTMLMQVGSEALSTITPYIQSFVDNYLPTIQNILQTIVTALGDALNFLMQHQTILAVMAGLITAVVVAIGLYNAVAAVKAAMDAAQVATLGALIAAYLAQAAAMIVAIAPYVLIVAAIAAVIAIIVVCIKHWDKIKETVAKVWDSIKQKTTEAVDKVKSKFEDMKNAIGNKVDAVKTAVTTKFEAVKAAITDKVEAAKSAVTNKFEAIRNAINQKVEAVKTGVSNGFNTIKSKMESTIEAAKSAITSKFEAIKSKITGAINGARDAVQAAVGKIKSIMNFSWSLPKLKLPHFSVSGKFSINPPSIPKFSVSWYKLGGVFDNPTLFPYGNGSIGGLGEDGAEAIVPLEKNTKWLDRIAERLGAGQGAQIVLQVDGKTFAQTSIDSINALTRQRGSLALNLV